MANIWKRCFAGVVALVATAAIGATIGLGQSASAQASYEITPREPEFLYDRTCGYCHGHNVGPVLKGRNLSPALIEYFVRNGNGAMPAFKPTEITNRELAALAQWLAAAPVDSTEHGQ